jgi:hypothetical protein
MTVVQAGERRVPDLALSFSEAVRVAGITMEEPDRRQRLFPLGSALDVRILLLVPSRSRRPSRARSQAIAEVHGRYCPHNTLVLEASTRTLAAPRPINGPRKGG